MADVACSICLEQLTIPVATPCGHVHCEKCLTAHIQAGNNACYSHCPTCRAKFIIAKPDMRYVPKICHEFLLPSVRRIYIEMPSQAKLKEQITSLESRVRSLARDKQDLMNKCESNIAASSRCAEEEKKERMNAAAARAEAEDWKKKYTSLKRDYYTLKSKTRSEDDIDSHPQSLSNASGSIPDPVPVDPSAGDTSTAASSSRIMRPLPSRAKRLSAANTSALTLDDVSMSVDPPSSYESTGVSNIFQQTEPPGLDSSGQGNSNAQTVRPLPKKRQSQSKRSRATRTDLYDVRIALD